MVKETIKCASFTLTGLVGLVMAIGVFFSQAFPYGHSPALGLLILMRLGYPVLCMWVGLLLRQGLSSRSWWIPSLVIKVVVAGIAVFSVYMFAHDWENYWWSTLPYLYLLSFSVGFLFPTDPFGNASRSAGWEYLVFLLIATFCNTAVGVALQRIDWLSYHAAFGGHEEMGRLILWLLKICEPLLVVLFLYFISMFSFSRLGQALDGKSWVRGIVTALMVFCLFSSIHSLTLSIYSAADIIQVLVQPVSIYIILVLSRLIRRRKKDLPWGDVFRV